MTRRQAVLLAALALPPMVGRAVAAGEAKPATKASAKPTSKAPAKKPPEPIHVWANRIRYQQKQGRALIQGNVTIIKHDFRIDCNQVDALLEPGTNRFRKLTATGNVRMCTVKPVIERTNPRPPLQPLPDARRAVCEHADYDPVKEIVILTGTQRAQPMVQIGPSRLWADRITYKRGEIGVEAQGHVRFDGFVPRSSAAPTPAPAPKPGFK